MKNIQMSLTSLNLQVDESETLTANVLPENADNRNIEWTTSNKAVATVENGTVTAVGSLSLLSIITIAIEIAFYVYFHWFQ